MNAETIELLKRIYDQLTLLNTRAEIGNKSLELALTHLEIIKTRLSSIDGSLDGIDKNVRHL